MIFQKDHTQFVLLFSPELYHKLTWLKFHTQALIDERFERPFEVINVTCPEESVIPLTFSQKFKLGLDICPETATLAAGKP